MASPTHREDVYKRQLPVIPALINVDNSIDCRVHLASRKIRGIRVDETEVEAGLSCIVRDFQRVVYPRVFGQIFHAMDDAAFVPIQDRGAVGSEHRLAVIVQLRMLNPHERSLYRRPIDNDVVWLSAPKFRHGKAQPLRRRLLFQIRLGDDIGETAIEAYQFRHVLEFGKARVQPIVDPCSVQLPSCYDLAKGLSLIHI